MAVLRATAGKPSTMPHLERWAEQATVFERFYAATAATQPSHASMFTGLQPWQHGVTGNRLHLGDHHVTVAERLHEVGFATAAVVASLPVTRRFGFGQGFDHFDDELVAGEAPRGVGEEEAFELIDLSKGQEDRGRFIDLRERILDGCFNEWTCQRHGHWWFRRSVR